MFKYIRNSKVTRVVASYLSIQLVLSLFSPSQLMALTQGPGQPEFQAFTPIGATDMVDLSSGDFNYNIPLMDVGGYPVNLAYQSGITMDQEASWVGLGWNLNVGQINRQMRGLPDEFSGDEMRYENNLRDNRTVGMGFNINVAALGLGDTGAGDAGGVTSEAERPPDPDPDGEGGSLGSISVSAGLTVMHNNYRGMTFEPSYGLGFSLGGIVQTGMNITTSADNGVTVNQNLGISAGKSFRDSHYSLGMGLNFGLGYNSRQGLSNFNLGASFSANQTLFYKSGTWSHNLGSYSGSGSISFLNHSFTPTKRNRFSNSNLSMGISVGGEVWGVHAEVGVTAFGTTQSLIDREESVPAFGYNNTHLGGSNAVLDFNREKETAVSKKTLALPPTNYTYDVYNISGQGIGGVFRPFRSQVGQVFTPLTADESGSDSFGLEGEIGVGVHGGVDYTNTEAVSRTGNWDTSINRFFDEDFTGNPANYENVYYKLVGETTIDQDNDIYDTGLGATDPIRFKLTTSEFGKTPLPTFEVKNGATSTTGETAYNNLGISGSIKRTQRELRTTAILPVLNSEAAVISETKPIINHRNDRPAHHIAGYKVVKPDGSRYNYGQTLYNNFKEEVTFAVGTNNGTLASGNITGEAEYSALENSLNNDVFPDNYYNRVITPEYSHTYLLTSVLSSDYEDISQDGPTPDDLGAYTLFEYDIPVNDFQYRVPYNEDRANFNQGLNTDRRDQKGSYIYGSKELAYLKTIETKTHIAVFTLGIRNDNKGVLGPDGGRDDSSSSYLLEKIALYSKPECGGDDCSGAEPIKEVHFVYDYSLCQGVPNNVPGAPSSPRATENQGGKLTLKSVYFTYRDSNLGQYSPYEFSYSDINPDYHVKGFDVWGNYKPEQAANYSVSAALSNMEFPFVDQSDREQQNDYASAWTLNEIQLPSGGMIQIDYEADDYAYVQDKKAMAMFKIVGFSTPNVFPDALSDTGDLLYTNGSPDGTLDSRYAVVELTGVDPTAAPTIEQFKAQYLGSDLEKPIYFRTMLNMTKPGYNNGPTGSTDYDYVTGYFTVNDDPTNTPFSVFVDGGKVYAGIPMKFSDLEGKGGDEQIINPISKAGWYFARNYLPQKAFQLPDYSGDGQSLKQIATRLTADFSAIGDLLYGQNEILRNREQVARRAFLEKSWLRLQLPGAKIGGGARVKEIRMYDNWKSMLGKTNEIYDMNYGQTYSYVLEDGTTSGVATYEPNMSKENPFVVPFYNEPERLVAPKEVNYIEEPFGESFFPSARVTYARVEVQNLARERTDGGESQIIKKHATGKVVTEFFTSKDFPTQVDYTDLNSPSNWASNDHNVIGRTFGELFGADIEVESELTLSQGFSIVTNDMNGRQRKQSVYNEYGDLISGVDYIYKIDAATGQLDNVVPVIAEDGTKSEKLVGIHYDVINDFKQHYSQTSLQSYQANLDVIPLPFLPLIIPMNIPKFSTTKATLNAVTTTKVVHQSGIMVEKIAYDLGASVSTKNLAWDAKTGQVLLTETVNEYDDHYFNTNFPAYWNYDRMGLASENLGMRGTLSPVLGTPDYQLDGYGAAAEPYFKLGDELVILNHDALLEFSERYWVSSNLSGNLQLIDRFGKLANICGDLEDSLEFVLIRSGNQNMQVASMASITAQVNPYDTDGDGTLSDLDLNSLIYNGGNYNPRIVNASAVDYEDFWLGQNEDGVPSYPDRGSADLVAETDMVQAGKVFPEGQSVNPFLYNIKGQWRADESYAFLAGRGFNDSDLLSPRNEGFFDQFEPYYTYNSTTGQWVAAGETSRWTSASEVTQYSPFGSELENKDALDRYSAAQYGYDYTLPVAVASNSRYGEIGFDGFEDYSTGGPSGPGLPSTNNEDHFDFSDALGAIPSLDITDSRSHTGQFSLMVPPNTAASMSKTWGDCAVTLSESDECTDPIGVVVTGSSACDQQVYVDVTITGAPNEVVDYSFDFTELIDAVSGSCFDTHEITIDGSTFTTSVGSGTVTLDASGSLSLHIVAEIFPVIDTSSGIPIQKGLVRTHLDDVFYTITFSNSANSEAVDTPEMCMDQEPCF